MFMPSLADCKGKGLPYQATTCLYIQPNPRKGMVLLKNWIKRK